MTFFWLIIHFSVLLAVKLAIPYSLYIMYIILIFPFHILHSFHLSYLGGPTFPFGAPKSRKPEAHLLSNYQFKQFFCYFINYTFVSILTFRIRIRSRFVFRVITVSIIKFSDLGVLKIWEPRAVALLARAIIRSCLYLSTPMTLLSYSLILKNNK